MNIGISEACNQASDAEKGMIESRLAILFVPESIVEAERTDMDKDKFILVNCRYRSSAEDFAKIIMQFMLSVLKLELQKMCYVGT